MNKKLLIASSVAFLIIIGGWYSYRSIAGCTTIKEKKFRDGTVERAEVSVECSCLSKMEKKWDKFCDSQGSHMEPERCLAAARRSYFKCDSRRHGKFEQFWSNKNIQMETTYKHGKIDGKYKKYGPEGKLREEGSYDSGKLQRDTIKKY